LFDSDLSGKKIIKILFFNRKSPIRPNDRVLSVSGKLRCSRCNDELGKYLNFQIVFFYDFYLLKDKVQQWLLNPLDYIIISNVFVVLFVIFLFHHHLKGLMFVYEAIDFIVKIVFPMKMVRTLYFYILYLIINTSETFTP